MAAPLPAQLAAPLPPAPQCQYASCYCEENVHQLCRSLQLAGPDHLSRAWAVFISNYGRCVPLSRQRAGAGQDGDVVWDYHVILLYRGEGGDLVYDLDSTLPFPAPAPLYCSATFGSEQGLPPQFHRRFRALPAALFLTSFSSDRRHMRTEDGAWSKEPPSWPCIRGAGGEEHNLDTFIDMGEGGLGEVHGLASFVERFSR